MTRQDKSVRAPKAARSIFAEFKDDPDPEVRQRASNWSVAIGLQDVDHLSVSQFLIDTAKRNIRGEITQEEVERLIEEYHSKGREHFTKAYLRPLMETGLIERSDPVHTNLPQQKYALTKDSKRRIERVAPL